MDARDQELSDLRLEREVILALLKDAPPRQMIDDQRYWLWRQKVDALLLTIKE